jgi:hypothetical protein
MTRARRSADCQAFLARLAAASRRLIRAGMRVEIADVERLMAKRLQRKHRTA